MSVWETCSLEGRYSMYGQSVSRARVVLRGGRCAVAVLVSRVCVALLPCVRVCSIIVRERFTFGRGKSCEHGRDRRRNPLRSGVWGLYAVAVICDLCVCLCAGAPRPARRRAPAPAIPYNYKYKAVTL